ncbi:hypothetical protein ACQR3P_28655 [Rhodococcus sp. IEGM1300]
MTNNKTNNTVLANTTKEENTMTNTTTLIGAIEYLEANYNVGDAIDLPAFLIDNGPIIMAANLLNDLCEAGVLDINHMGINVDQEVADYSYTYTGYEQALLVGAMPLVKDAILYLRNLAKKKANDKVMHYYHNVNAHLTNDMIVDEMARYWNVWGVDFFPEWTLATGNKKEWNTTFIAACNHPTKTILWFANADQVRAEASSLCMDWSTYVRVTLAHELGHAADLDLKVKYLLGTATQSTDADVIQYEVNAYRNGVQFTSRKDRKAYHRMNMNNLNVYKEKHSNTNTTLHGLAMDETSVVQLTAPAFPNTSMSNLYVEDVPTLPLWVFAKQGKATQMASFLKKPHHFCHVSHTDMQLLFKMAKGTNINIMRILDRANPAPNKEMNKRVFISFDRNIGQRSNEQLSDNREQIIANVALKLKGKPVKIYTANSLVRKIFLENGVHCFHTNFDVLSEVGNFVHLFVMNSQNKSSLQLVTRSLFMGNRIVPAYY